MGRETVRRLWREENLRVSPRRKPKPRQPHKNPPFQVKAERPGHVWALDFQFDSDINGRAIKICNVLDEFTREHVGYLVDRFITARQVSELLDVISLERGRPLVLRMDNGPEFVSERLKQWCKESNTMQAFIPPGQPWKNGYVESFHNRMRDELLVEEIFDSPTHADQAIKAWSHRYNHYHPHSALGALTPAEYAAQWANNQPTPTLTTNTPKN